MSGAFNLPNNANAQVRLGFEDPLNCGVPAPPESLIFHPPFQTTDVGPEETPVEVTNISSAGHKLVSLPGKSITGGALSAQTDADGLLPALVAPLLNNDVGEPGTDLLGGAFGHTYGPSQPNATPVNYTVGLNTGDDLPSIMPGTGTLTFTVTVANGAAKVTALDMQSTYETAWGTGVERHPNPTDSTLFARGVPTDWLDRFAGQQGDVYAVLRGEETDAQGRILLVVQAVVGRPGPITGAWTIGAGTDTATAPAGTGLAKTEVFDGDTHEIDGVLLRVQSVTDDDTIVYTATHTPGAAAVTISREYATAGFFTVLPGRSGDTRFAVWNKARHSTGEFMGDRALTGSTIELHATGDTGIVQPVTVSIAGTVSVTSGANGLAGTATSFLSELYVGGLVSTAGGQSRRVESITSDTVATVVSNWTITEGPVAATAQAQPTVALTGLVTTAADLTLVGDGSTLFDTELDIGSWVRTGGGEVRRIATITDFQTATVTRAFANTEAAVTAETDYEWQFPRISPTWTSVIHASGLFPEVITGLKVFYPDTQLPEETVEIAESFEFTFTAATQPVSGIGGKFLAAVVQQGQSLGTFVGTLRNVSTRSKKAIISGARVRFKIEGSTGKVIGTSLFEYGFDWTLNGKIFGKPPGVPDADTNQIVVSGELFPNDSDPEFPDACQLFVRSDRMNPVLTVPLS